MRQPGQWVVGVAAVLAAGCGEDARKVADAGARVEQAAKSVVEAARQVDMNKVGDAVVEMGSAFAAGSSVDPVDFRTLKALLPESLARMKRVDAGGSRTNVLGVASSRAQGTYQDGRGGRFEVEIIDVGSFTGLTSLTFAWLKVEIDRESDDGYERTLTLEGRKGFERYSKKSRSGELDVIVASRFVVLLRGTGVDAAAFRDALKQIDLRKLEALKSEGVPPTTAATK